jgi:hypothetical protein
MNVYNSPFENNGDGVEDECTLYSLANEFMESALELEKFTPVNVKYTSSIIYLLCHASELFLKSVLYAKGQNKAKLKRFGHDLSLLLGMVKIENFDVRNYQNIQEISLMYRNKELEYRVNRKSKLPNIHSLINEVKSLKGIAFDVAFAKNA